MKAKKLKLNKMDLQEMSAKELNKVLGGNKVVDPTYPGGDTATATATATSTSFAEAEAEAESEAES
ncbi:hypothetical protein [Chitinophaga nivalis]|uniref:Bacteriocin n=1 Tax=Chitinophaga nivalis TaxID=2991709 RepID=A0ABT3IJM3_9BACT|nr:hypothetical protein [Chitinophaga nivalis]MCW3466143.1 hypothetical protein [Chitinophaga nivalis]MCW3484166.1 hypothetical protein [Chitinophaga nivalis]